jgi:hypothetical protein
MSRLRGALIALLLALLVLGDLTVAVAHERSPSTLGMAPPIPAVPVYPAAARRSSPDPRIQAARLGGSAPITIPLAAPRDTPPAAPVATAWAVAVQPPRPALASDTGRVFRAGTPDSAPEPVLLELRIASLVSRTVQAFRVGTEALLPLSQLLSMAEVRYHITPVGLLEATVSEGRRLVIGADRDTMTFGSQRVRIEQQYRLFQDGELYVGAERLGNLLGTRIVVDWAALTVTVMDAGDLPVGQRTRREAAREALRRQRAGRRVDMALGFEGRRIDGLVLDYSALLPGGQSLGGGSYALALGADVYGGSFVLGLQSVGRADAGVVQGDGSWTRVWEQNRLVRQLRLGDGYTTGPHVRALRGVSLTNAPYLRDPVLGTSPFDGQLQPGWAVEAYQNGQLIAFDTTDATGQFGFRIPIRYGENPVDFVAYGPLGEVRRFYRTYRVLSDLLPERRLEYGVAGGACRDSRCRASGNVDVRYGMTDRVTVEAGADRFWRDSLADLWHPYVGLTANPANSWAVELEGVGNALARAAIIFEPSVNLRVSAEAAAFDPHPAAPILTVPGQRSLWTVSGFYRPVPRIGFLYLDGRVDRLGAVDGTTTRTRLGVSVQTSTGRLLPYVRTERQAPLVGPAATQQFLGLNAYLLPRPSWGRWAWGTFVRTAVESQLFGGAAKLMLASAAVSKPILPGMSLEAGIGWLRGARGPFLQFTLNTYLPAVRSYTTVTAPSGAPATVSQLVQGSVLWDRPSGHLATAPGPSIERAGLAGRVFRDLNFNGRWDAGEPGVAGVRVLVGSKMATSDSDGTFRVWDLVPFEPVPVYVDSLSIDSPLLVPAFALATIVPGPNRFRTLDVPIIAAGVLEGHVSRDLGGGHEPAGAVPLVLVDRRTGTERHFSSFSDGAFYVMSVTPGRYTLAVDESVLRAWQMTAQPLEFTLAPTPEGVGRNDLELVLTPAH